MPTIQRPTQPTVQRPTDRILIALERGKRQVIAAVDRCEATIAQAVRQPER